MKRLKLFISIFCLAVSLPLAYVIWQTYSGLAREEQGQLQFFCEALFDEMEAELAALVQREENRAVDEYQPTPAERDAGLPLPPLAQPPANSYLLGYLQNNPDGSFQTPLAAGPGKTADQQNTLIDQLVTINTLFNRKKLAIPVKRIAPEAEKTAVAEDKSGVKRKLAKKAEAAFADRYIAKAPQKSSKRYLGKKAQRTEEITADQALNLSQEGPSILRQHESQQKQAVPELAEDQDAVQKPTTLTGSVPSRAAPPASQLKGSVSRRFQVEVAPFQSVSIDDAHFFIFRRIAINNQIYRQGFVLKWQPFLRHLASAHFESQPMARFSRLELEITTHDPQPQSVQFGAAVHTATYTTQRTFPAPFDFLRASLQTDAVPSSPARRTLNVALLVLVVFMLLGLFGIYQSARAVVALSERRSQFVSSVTHELKTPLTNIRMYIEMLEQGIAATPDREQDYFKILGSESTRLSRLINNVLELAKLEKQQRNFDMQVGHLSELLVEVKAIMAHKIEQEGFSLEIKAQDLPAFFFDREVLIQVLINLLENSIKFGRNAAQRQITIRTQRIGDRVHIAVTDSGPGIPKKELKKIFDDFYRVDNDLTRTTGGTGIGLALVKRFISAMGGSIQAVNNEGPGCTIILMLPFRPPTPK